MKILILGGAGFLGANLVRRCLAEMSAARGDVLTVMDSLDPHLHATTQHLRPEWDRIRFVRGDMRDETLLADPWSGSAEAPTADPEDAVAATSKAASPRDLALKSPNVIVCAATGFTLTATSESIFTPFPS